MHTLKRDNPQSVCQTKLTCVFSGTQNYEHAFFMNTKSQILLRVLKMVEINQAKTGAWLLVPGHSALQSKTQYGGGGGSDENESQYTTHPCGSLLMG